MIWMAGSDCKIWELTLHVNLSQGCAGFIDRVDKNAKNVEVSRFRVLGTMGKSRGGAAGGIIGLVDFKAKVTVQDCINFGSVTSDSWRSNIGTGGMIGSVNYQGEVNILRCGIP